MVTAFAPRALRSHHQEACTLSVDSAAQQRPIIAASVPVALHFMQAVAEGPGCTGGVVPALRVTTAIPGSRLHSFRTRRFPAPAGTARAGGTTLWREARSGNRSRGGRGASARGWFSILDPGFTKAVHPRALGPMRGRTVNLTRRISPWARSPDSPRLIAPT